MSLSPLDLSALVTDYELVTPGGSTPDAQTETRETLLNKFMAHIGVGSFLTRNPSIGLIELSLISRRHIK